VSEAGGRVFVVDDDASVGKSLGRLLKSAGYDVEILASADEFMQRVPFEDVGCLILDVQMPGLNGLELQKTLARSNCAPPIVFITGYGDLPMSAHAIEAGALDFIQKPFNDETLLKAVDKALLKWQQAKGKPASCF
jgi:two-component system response regulator FixJ